MGEKGKAILCINFIPKLALAMPIKMHIQFNFGINTINSCRKEKASVIDKLPFFSHVKKFGNAVYSNYSHIG